MPFPYQASATPVRTRKPLRDRDKDREKDRERDKDARSITSSGTRRHREASRSSNRSPLPSSSQPSSVYSQGNVTLDQLPPLPRSETASPSSLRSPTLRASTGPSSSSTPLTSSTHLYTPAALQQYLETDDNEEYDDVQTPQASSMVHTKQYFEPEVTRTPYRPESAQKRSPVSSTAPPDTETKPASPPIPSASPLSLSRVNTRLSDPSPSLHHPRPFNFASSKPAFTQPLPLFAGPPSEPYLPHFPPGSQYFPMTHQASNQPIDIQSLPPQNYYQPYASPPQMPPSFNPMRSPPAREYSSQSSRISFSGDPPLAESAPAAPPPPLAASSQGAPKRDEDAILHRIQSAIPDLHLIVNQYREIAGQLNERDLKLRHTEAEKTKVLEQRDTYIDRLTKERDEAFHKNDEENKKHNEEKSKLRLEVGNMSEQLNELHEKFQKETRVKRDLENQLENMRAHCALRESESKAEKTAMGNEYALWKSQTDGELAAMEKALRMKEGECDRLQRQLRELEAQFQARTAESEQNRRMEKEGLELTMAKQKKELEDICTKLQRELDDTKSAHGKALDMHLKKHNQEKEIWTQDRQSLMRDWERERAKTGQGSAELHAQHQKEKEELQENWKASRLRLENEHSEAMAKMQAEMNSAKASWDADKAQFNRVKAELKATAAQLNTENTKLQKLADAFEQVTDLRGRGDAYYIQAFEGLWQQISALAEHICSDCPAQIPSEHFQRIPSDMPPFLVDTPASTRVRTAYVQSLISAIINNRIFQPFLFTHGELEDTFAELSEYFRGKSTRKEAFWRQRTLLAAFSCGSSKDKINNVASHIVDEIVANIKAFTDGSKRTQMRAAVKQIVKKAAETWRYARIELSRITASTATGISEEQNGEQLLPVFPQIVREPLPKGFGPGSTDDPGCVYFPGQSLSKKSSAVLARRVELGEIPATPAAAQAGRSTIGRRPEFKAPRKMSNEIATRARRFEPRSISPLGPLPPENSQTSRGKAAIAPDELSPIHPGEQHEHGEEWETDSQSSSHEESSGGQERGKERHDGSLEAAGAEQAAGSPQHFQSPRLSQRSTRTTDRSSEDDAASGVTERPSAPPDWGGAGSTPVNMAAPPGASGW